ncbi:MAG: hypothetical protein K0V04_38445 [Deltaproteobacteria bacterium]|nr:hypothetical protein [Deltaproteobacteria bacterium]
MGRGVWWGLAWPLLTIVVGCAVGADSDTTFGPPTPVPEGMTESGVDTDDGGSTTMGPMPEPMTDDGDSTGLPPDDTTTTGEGAESSDGGPMGECTNAEMCASAAAIGGVSGDSSSPSIDVSGVMPTWVAFEVSEDDSGVFGSDLSFTATLSSPAGADFDLHVFRGAEGANSGCGGFMQQSTNAGGLDSVSMSWGEGGVANNSDDGVWVAVEIRAKNDVCAPPDEWTLVVSGNT